MKKIIIALCALLAVFACSKNEMDIQAQEQERDNTPMSFNLSVNPMNVEAETKAALKADWSNGDAVFIFFDAIPTKYIKKYRDGGTWTNSFPGGDFVASDFSAEGPATSRNMTAVWFPKALGEVTVTYADSKFSFTIGGEKIYSHYMSVHAGYTVDGTTVSGILTMEKPAGFVQFFVPGITAAEAPTYRLMESHLTPKACDYVALDGGVTESARTAGYSIKGMAFTSDESVTGALFGGFLSSAGAATDYTFSLVKEISVEKPAAVGTYTLSGNKTINEGTSMTFPAFGNTVWGTMSPFVDLGFGDIQWATGNLNNDGTIADPLLAGDYYKWCYTTPYDVAGTTDAYNNYYTGVYNTNVDPAYLKSSGAWHMPSKGQFNALIDNSNTTNIWVTGWTELGSDKGGRLITSKVNGISLFLAAAGFYQDGTPHGAGQNGYYWSYNLYNDSNSLRLSLDNDNFYVSASGRMNGMTVRPVYGALPTSYSLAESTVGMVVGTDGKAYNVADKDNLPLAVIAMVAYKNGSNGLAIQLNASPSSMGWYDAKNYVESLISVPGGSWHLPSKAEWQNMFVGCAIAGDAGKSEWMDPIAGFVEKIATAGATWQSGGYWTTSSQYLGRHYSVIINRSSSNPNAAFFEGSDDDPHFALGCLAF